MYKITLLFIALLFLNISILFAQDKKQIYYDEKGNKISFMEFVSIEMSGRYTSYSDSSSKYKVEWKWIANSEQQKNEFISKARVENIVADSIGQTFPGISFYDINNQLYNKDSLNGKIVFINYWFVGCTPCEAERPELNRLYEKYKNKDDIVFLSFSNSDEKTVRKFLKSHAINYPVAIFSRTLDDKLGISEFPVNIILDKSLKYKLYMKGISKGTSLLIEETLEDLL
ncbi:TlpA family protein disulfide reductase [Chondrinema litorale]|uniref:TlpA family protein disulfide reductase n=1 Tax=Chondrinema litorale TaxID=2994555 RepID=UPI0025431282|nr:TlpA disulfide reductase family protein [Chondrinema litorale]UZR98501.1 TlpA disulfide reductase family protein [Chondrinema litorale]